MRVYVSVSWKTISELCPGLGYTNNIEFLKYEENVIKIFSKSKHAYPLF
jgi:hypothetical protein